MAAPAQRLLNCSDQKQLDNTGESRNQSANSNLQNGSSNEDINSEEVSTPGNVISSNNRGKPRANNCGGGQNRDMKMDNFQDGGPRLSGRPNSAANPAVDQTGFASPVERTRLNSEFPNFNPNPREPAMVADEYRNSQGDNHAGAAMPGYGGGPYDRSGYPAEQHGGQPLPPNSGDPGASQPNSQQQNASKMFSQYQRAGFQPNPRGPLPRSANSASGMPPTMNYPPNSQQQRFLGGQSISQQGGPTPTLNQLLQAPNPLQRFQNNYGDYNSNQGMHKDPSAGPHTGGGGGGGHNQYPGSSSSPHGWSPTRGMSYQQQMAGMGAANYRGQNVPMQGPGGDPSIKRPPYMSPGGPQGGTPNQGGAPSPASSPQMGQFGQPPQQYPQRPYSQQQHRGPHNQNYPSPQMGGSPYGMHGTGASSGASNASQSGNNYDHQQQQRSQSNQSHQPNFQQSSGNNQSPQRENSSSNLEEHSSDSNSNSGQGGGQSGGGPGGRSSTPGSRTSGTPPSASGGPQQQGPGSQGGSGPGGGGSGGPGSGQQQQQQQSGSSQQQQQQPQGGNSGSQSQQSSNAQSQQQQPGNGNSANTSGNGNSNNNNNNGGSGGAGGGGNLQQGVSPLRPVPSPSGSSTGSRSMSPAIGQQQNIPMPPRPSSSQSDSIAPNTMSQTATGYSNTQMAPPMYGNKMSQGMMGSAAAGVQLNSYPQQGSHYTQGNYRNQNSMMMQGYGQGPNNFGSPAGHGGGGGGYSSSMMGVRMSSNAANTPPTSQNFGGYHNSQYNNTSGPSVGYGMNNMMPPPSQYPKSPGGLNSQVGAQAAAQAAVIAAASSATLRSSPMYIRHQLQQKMYGGSYNSMHPQVPNSQQGPGSGAPHPMGNLLPHPSGSSPNMPCQPDGISGAPPSVSAPSSSHSVGSSSSNPNMENSISSMDNSGNTSTSVTQSISSPVPAVSMMVSSPSMSNMVDMQSQSQQHPGMGGGGPPQSMVGGLGPQGGGGGRMPGGNLQSLPPPILDEASQASNASATSSLPDDRSETPKPNSKTSLSHPPTPNTLPSPGAASMSSFHEEFENVSSPSWPRTPSSPVVNNQGYDHHPIKRPDGLLKLYDMSEDPDRRNFLDKLIMYSEERGTPISQCPTISKQPLDLYRLYMAVKEKGGFVEVTKAKHWKDVAGLLGIGASSSAAYTLRKQYIKHLLPFECKFDRGGIDPNPIIQQVETSSRKKGAKNQPVCPDPFPPPSNQSLDGYPPSAYPGGYGPGPPGHHQMMNSEYPPPSVGPHMPPYQQGPPASHHPQGPPPPPPPPSSHLHGPGVVPNHMSPSNNVPPTVPTSSSGPENMHMTDPYSEDIQTSQYQRHATPDGYAGYGQTPAGSAMMPSYSSTQSSMSGGSFGFSSNTNVGSVANAPVSGHPPPPEQVYGNSGEQYPHHPSAAPPPPPPPSSEAPGYGARNAVPDPYGLPPGSYPPNRTIGGLPNTTPYPYQSQYDRERYDSTQGAGMIRPPSQPNTMIPSSQPDHQMYPQSRYGPGGQTMSSGSTGRETAIAAVPPPPPTVAPQPPANAYPPSRTGPMAQPTYPATPQQPPGQSPYPPPVPPTDSYNRVPEGYQGYPPNQQSMYGQATVPPNKVAPPGAPPREAFPRDMFPGAPKRHPDFMKSQMGPAEQYPPVAGYGQQPNTTGYPDRNQYPPYRATHMGMPPPTAGPGQPAWTRENQCRPYSSTNQSQYAPGMRESWDSSRASEGQTATTGPWQGRYMTNPDSYAMNSAAGQARGVKMPPYNRDRSLYAQPNKTHPGMSQSSQPYPVPPQKKELVFPPDTVEGVRPVLVKKRKLQAKDVSPVEAWRLMMAIKSGLLAESTWALDVLSVLLYDDNTILYFGLSHLPGLLEAVLDHYRRCLNVIFGLTEDVEIGYELQKLKNQDSSSETSDLKNKEQQTWPWFQTERDAEKSSQRDSLGSIASIDPCDKTVFLNTENYSFKTRCKKVVRCRTAETLFLIDPDKKWDCSEGFTSGADHWMLGGGDTSSFIQTHFENTYKLTKFARVMDNVNKENAAAELNDPREVNDGGANGGARNEDKDSKRLRDCAKKEERDGSKERVNTSTVVVPKKLLNVLNSKRNAISIDGLNLKELKEISSRDKDDKPKTLETGGVNSEKETNVIVKKEVAEETVEECSLQNGKEESPIKEMEKSRKESGGGVDTEMVESAEREKSVSEKDTLYPRKRPFPSSDGKRVNMDDLEDECYNRDEPSLCTLTPAQDSLARRCISLSTLLRNFSFVPGNDSEMAKHAGFLLIMGRVLLLHHSHGVKKTPQHHYEKEEAVAPDARDNADNSNSGANGENATPNQSADSCSSLLAEKEWWWDLLHHLRENTLVTLANISGHLDLTPYLEEISLPILDGLLHWAVCPSSYAQDPLPNLPTYSVLSPQRLSLEALCKLSTMDCNVDLLLATPPWQRMERLFAFLSRSLSKNEDQVTREFSVVLLSNLAQADSGVARAIALQGSCISQLITFVEQAEQSALQVANSQGINALRENPELMGTTLDMVRRAAATLRCLASVPDNRALFLQHQQRLLTLVMSQILDQGVASLVADVLYECSKKVPDFKTKVASSSSSTSSSSNTAATESTTNPTVTTSITTTTTATALTDGMT